VNKELITSKTSNNFQKICEHSSDDDDYLEIPDTIKHFVCCRCCHKVYNAKFSVFEEPDIDFLQKEHAVDVKYDCDTSCRECLSGIAEPISLNYFGSFNILHVGNTTPNNI
jgi:hypothetical protein